MAHSTPSRAPLIEIAVGITAVAFLAIFLQPLFAQRGAAGGMRSGGGMRTSGGSHATSWSPSVARPGAPSHAARNMGSEPSPVRARSHSMPGATPAARASSRPPLATPVSVLSSSRMPAGMATFKEPVGASHGSTASTSAANALNHGVTIGFPPVAGGVWSTGAIRGSAVSLSGQGRKAWHASQRAVTSATPDRLGPAGLMLVAPSPPRGSRPRPFPPRIFAPVFLIFGPGFGFFGPFSPFGPFGTGCGFLGECGFSDFGEPGCNAFWAWDCGAYGDYMPMYYSAGGVGSGAQDGTSMEYGPFAWQSAPLAPSNTQAPNSPGDTSATASDTLIYLNDGTSYAVTDYWLAGSKLHYVTSYGGQNSIDLQQLDFQRTVDENASRGVAFTLRPAPASAPVSPHQ
jgi:hypothetical protein